MSVPTHNLSCQTWIYGTKCWYCGDPIHVLQCTCGSVVLFDKRGWPWPEHHCSGGIGGSGLSGWNAVDVLRANGIPISSNILAKIFPGGVSKRKPETSEAIRAVKPTKNKGTESLLAVVRELHTGTKKTATLEAVSGIGAKLFGLPKGHLWQITLVVNSQRPNLSYTCVLPERIGLPRTSLNKMALVQIEPKVAGDHAIWLVSDIRIVQ